VEHFAESKRSLSEKGAGEVLVLIMCLISLTPLFYFRQSHHLHCQEQAVFVKKDVASSFKFSHELRASILTHRIRGLSTAFAGAFQALLLTQFYGGQQALC
jgi:hypothetical protein